MCFKKRHHLVEHNLRSTIQLFPEIMNITECSDQIPLYSTIQHDIDKLTPMHYAQPFL